MYDAPFFPAFESEERNKLIFNRSRRRRLQRLIQLYSKESFSQINFDFNPFMKLSPLQNIRKETINFIKTVNIPSCMIPDKYTPIKIGTNKSTYVPLNTSQAQKTVKTKKDNIPTPNWYITDDDDPYINGQDTNVTHRVTFNITQNHKRLEAIEDMVRIGTEKRVTTPYSMIQLFQLNQDVYSFDKDEIRKLNRYNPKNDDEHYMLKSWPTRVYDDKYSYLSDELQSEYDRMLNDYNRSRSDAIDSKIGSKSKSKSTSVKLKFKFLMEKFDTDSEKETEPEDYVI